MAQNSDDFENLRFQYLTSLTSRSKIKNTKAVFIHLDDFLILNNLTYEALSLNINNFKSYLQQKVGKQTFDVYLKYFMQFYSWLETNYLKTESVFKPQKPQPQTPAKAPALTKKDNEQSYAMPPEEGEYPTESIYPEFNCNLLCKNARYCTFNGFGYLTEIDANNCFVSRFPIEFETKEGKIIKSCLYQQWKSYQPHGDPKDPFPTCLAKQKDVPLQLPKDRIIRDPDFCWNCLIIRKRQRKQQRKLQEEKALARQTFRPAKVDWGDSGYFDTFRLGDGK